MKNLISLAAISLVATFFMTSSLASDAKLPDFTTLIEGNAKTVVQIESRGLANENSKLLIPHNGQPMPEDLLRYFFEGPGLNFRQAPKRPSLSYGSGFFIDDKGYILTNAHVIKDGDEITVTTIDKKEYKAKLIGFDKRTDIALLKINKNNSKSVKIGNSDNVKVGNWVVAIGSPFGFDHTATKGIVSAVYRSLPDGTYVPFIQTDAAVNPGNSGGPLFNLDGEVIGVNSQIYSRTGSFNGLAFAIPINTAMHVANQLKSKGFVSRGWLGVSIQSVNQDLAASFGLDKPTGALVTSIMPDSPAKLSGIIAGDIILQFDGKKINKSADLPPLVGNIPIGTEVKLQILRKGKNKTISVKIGELDEGHSDLTNKGKRTFNRGLSVRNLTKSQKRELSVNKGVIVVNIKPRTKAAKAGFRLGDVIISINNKDIKNVKSFINALKNTGDNPVAVLVIRDGRSIFIPL